MFRVAAGWRADSAPVRGRHVSGTPHMIATVGPRYRRPETSGVWALGPRQIDIWCAPVSAFETGLDQMRGLLSDEERRNASRFRFDDHRRVYIMAHAFVRMILGGYTREEPSRLLFGRGPGTKPRLLSDPRLRFNSSHSAGLVLIAVSMERDVGIDVERVLPLADFEELARRFFSAGECEDLFTLDRAARLRGFFDCWTRKEAFVKATGDGLLKGLDHFRVAVRPGEPVTILHIDGDERQRWSLLDLQPSPDYAAALAVRERDFETRCWKLEEMTQLTSLLS